MAKVIDGLLAWCDDCALAIANADYTGLTGARAEEIRTAVSRLYQRGYPMVGQEVGYVCAPCDCCQTRLAGTRHSGSILEG